MTDENTDARMDGSCFDELSGLPRHATSPRERRSRDIALLRKTLSMLCRYIWDRSLRSGDHLWSIPVDQERDFDCIFSDAIAELEELRTRVAAPSADGCSGVGRPSCKAAECMFGLDKKLEPKRWSCAFTDEVIPELSVGLCLLSDEAAKGKAELEAQITALSQENQTLKMQLACTPKDTKAEGASQI